MSKTLHHPPSRGLRFTLKFLSWLRGMRSVKYDKLFMAEYHGVTSISFFKYLVNDRATE